MVTPEMAANIPNSEISHWVFQARFATKRRELGELLAIQGSEDFSHFSLDPRLDAYLAAFDRQIEGKPQPDHGMIYGDENGFGGFLAKAGKRYSGDRVVSSETKQFVAVIDGVKPADMEPEEAATFESGSADAFASETVANAAIEVVEMFKGYPSPQDFIHQLSLKLVEAAKTHERRTGKILTHPPRASAAFLFTFENLPHIMLMGDINAVGITKDGDLVNLLKTSEQYWLMRDPLYQRLDRHHGALKTATNDKLAHQFAQNTFENKVGEKKMRLLAISPDINRVEAMVGTDTIQKCFRPIPPEVVGVIMATDGFAEQPEFMPFFALMPQIINYDHGRQYQTSPAIGSKIPFSLAAQRELQSTNLPNNLERARGLADDDSGFYIWFRPPLTKNRALSTYDRTDATEPIQKALVKSQRAVLSMLTDRKVILGDREHDEQVIRNEIEFVTQIIMSKTPVADEKAREMAENYIAEELYHETLRLLSRLSYAANSRQWY